MIYLNSLPKPSKFTFSIFILPLFTFLAIPTPDNPEISEQCFTATYSIVSDYSNTGWDPVLIKTLSKEAESNKLIYTISQSSTQSYEQVDSIAFICGGQPAIVKQEGIFRTAGQESIDYFYFGVDEPRSFSVLKPKYLDGWKIKGPIAFNGSKDRYFKAVKGDSDDYLIFDTNTPVPHNMKLITGIPGLVVEASIGRDRINLLDFKSSSCSYLNDKINQVQKAILKRSSNC
ncbi:MAG: hypothetical protein R2879_19460 [Saprospiraceae bacterium]